MVISVDRLIAVMCPLSVNTAITRGKRMLCVAWIFSVISSVPQSFIFHTENHPSYPWFQQCVTFNFFPTKNHELAYSIFHLTALYVLPLIVIIVSYSLILCKITKKSRECSEIEMNRLDYPWYKSHHIQNSGMSKIIRARRKTLKMTIVIVLVFATCWTPYFTILSWWLIDRETAAQINSKIERGLFIFAVSNSCMNPIVYGLFVFDIRKELERCCPCIGNKRKEVPIFQYNNYPRMPILPNRNIPSPNIDNRQIMKACVQCNISSLTDEREYRECMHNIKMNKKLYSNYFIPTPNVLALKRDTVAHDDEEQYQSIMNNEEIQSSLLKEEI